MVILTGRQEPAKGPRDREREDQGKRGLMEEAVGPRRERGPAGKCRAGRGVNGFAAV